MRTSERLAVASSPERLIEMKGVVCLARLVLAGACIAFWPALASGATLKIAALSPEGSVWMKVLR